MSFMNKLFGGKRLSTLKTAAEFEAAAASLEAELRDAIAARDRMEGAREQAIFSNGDVDAVRQQVAEQDERIEWLTSALSGSRKRLEEAREAEAQAEHDRKMTALKKEIDRIDAKHGKPRRDAYRAYEAAAREIAKALTAIEQHNAPVEEANDRARNDGRPDFMIPDPLADARERYNELARNAGGAYVPNNVPNLPDAVMLPGHWPFDRNPYGSPFDKL